MRGHYVDIPKRLSTDDIGGDLRQLGGARSRIVILIGVRRVMTSGMRHSLLLLAESSMRRFRHLPRALVLAVSVVASTLWVPTIGVAQHASDSLAIAPVVTAHRKYPALAVALGIVPGAGHLYAGDVRRGLTVVGAIAVVAMSSAFIAAGDCGANDSTNASAESCENDNVLAAGGLLILGIWGWSIIDAGMAATRTNRRMAAEQKVALLSRVPLTFSVSRRPTANAEDARALNVGLRFSVR